MVRLADVVLSHRLLVVMVWLVVAVAGAVTAPRTVQALTYDFGLPGQPATTPTSTSNGSTAVAG